MFYRELSVMLSVAGSWAARICNCFGANQETEGHSGQLLKAASGFPWASRVEFRSELATVFRLGIALGWAVPSVDPRHMPGS